MIQGCGISACKGIVIGKIYIYQTVEAVRSISSGDPQKESVFFQKAKAKAVEELEVLYEQISMEFGEKEASIFGMQQLMLEDINFVESVETYIQEGKSAAMAVYETGETLGKIFDVLEDEYIKERASDIRDITKRVLCIMNGGQQDFLMEEPGIIITEDLSPTDIVALSKERILGFLIQKGSNNNHTAILGRTMNIPALIQADIVIEDSLSGKLMIIDAYEEQFYIDPTPDIVKNYEERLKALPVNELEETNHSRGKSITKSGEIIEVFANIGTISDVDDLLKQNADGIGLLRSEFLYLGRTSFPTEEELFHTYKSVAIKMQGKKVVIRTFDVGADKQVDYFQLEQEVNPALGYRGIRICLEQLDLFRVQMRAIYRASFYGNIAVMFPMIISVKEVREIKGFCEMIQTELQEEGVTLGVVELGIMIETPAAALTSELLAKEVDFFSVGTNDLTQYTIAIDRENERLTHLYDPYHPAIMMQLQLIASNAKKAGIRACICGELAADRSMTAQLLQMGYTQLSVASREIVKIKQEINQC